MESSWISFLSLCLLSGLSNGLQCRDDNNIPVDWFVIYKIPRQMSKIREIHKGTEYVVLTSISQTTNWALSQKDVTMQDSALGNTLSPLYNDTVAESSIWVVYNDYNPENADAKPTLGQGRGVLMANQGQGFWLIHSVPSYPALPKSGNGRGVRTPGIGYGYPETAKKLGQMFLCISITTDQLNVIGRQLWYDRISMNRKHLPGHLVDTYSNFAKAVNGKKLTPGMHTDITEFRSINGHIFRSFASSAAWQRDLWDDLVGPSLMTNLSVKSSLNGMKNSPSKCNGNFTVRNINKIAIREVNCEVLSGNDSSKWAISSSGNWFCIGDVNRIGAKKKRAGGAVCIQARNIWLIFRRMITNVEECP